MKSTYSIISFLSVLLCSSAFATEKAQQQYPTEYKEWQQTLTQSENEDMLEKYPATVILWAGSGFSKDYNSPRGHQFAVTDAARTLRTGVAPKDGKMGKSASCWTCKTPQAWQTMNMKGEEGFAAMNFTDIGPYVNQVVHCDDCHKSGSDELALPRPHAQNAMKKVKLPFEKQPHYMQSSQTCGQCHVTYYFQPEAENKVNIPWIFGSTADLIEKYYDTRRFYEWIHPISQVPMLKARHPEFEHWSRSSHAKHEVGCVDCHMPIVKDEQGNKHHSHQVGSASANFDTTCKACHSNKEYRLKLLEENTQWVETTRKRLEDSLVKAHYEAQAAWKAGASVHQMNEAIMAIRHSQWRWDFITASHGAAAHNPDEAKQVLNIAVQQVSVARSLLAKILKDFKVETVNYPDYSSKAKAQQAIGLDIDSLTKEKRDYIEQVINKEWQPVANIQAGH
ncbi:ammonia-forming cytochrome c nitrite reductase subunit c552 [Paraferrimonas haliotis]|uniref:nitrite reductase (cytochrome; ammonia-forming) n=1 Tax=Paraferrimonas haliotis TaxID=2013866 RepID=A0AA37WXK9_9GAMM|nr:ammonia-forming cytochrome c nitrite reductase subunit c552 [Paraferrimonas haliotis]GLS84768.1 cytochrome c-552 [Paraferrimonas haliotis]